MLHFFSFGQLVRQWAQRQLPMQVLEARAASEKAQLLLSNVAERKRQKQTQRDGLVIVEGLYGDIKNKDRNDSSDMRSVEELDDDDGDLPPPHIDVTIPLQFLVDDSGELRVGLFLFLD